MTITDAEQQLAELRAELERERASRMDWAAEAVRLDIEVERLRAEPQRPSTSGDDATADALQRFRQRVAIFCEQYSLDGDNPQAEPDYWPDVITQEAGYLLQEGPAAYLRYVAELDAAAVRADAVRERRHLRPLAPPLTP